DGGRQRDGRMTDQAIFNFAWPDAKTGRGYDIVITSDETDITFVIHDALIAGRHPVADELVARRFRIAPVFKKHHGIRPFHRDLAGLTGPQLIAVIVDDRDRMSGNGLADCSCL